MDIIFHYPPELLQLLIDAIPKLCKGKKALLLFFEGAGVGQAELDPFHRLLKENKEGFNKYPVTRELLTKLNKMGEASLRERREIVKRVTEFNDFSLCYENDQAAARGLVAQIRDLVNVKDSFTRINLEREKERQERLEPVRRAAEERATRKIELGEIRRQFFALFSESNPHKRGKAVEAVLNQYFQFSRILVSEAIAVRGDAAGGIVEQIDGVIQLRGQLYLVEMKWEKETLGRDKVASHLVRVFGRSLAGGIIISNSEYSDAAVNDCRDALRQKVIILCKLEELVRAIERETELSAILEAKIDAAIIHKNPLFVPAP
jgi:hypothetical protein